MINLNVFVIAETDARIWVSPQHDWICHPPRGGNTYGVSALFKMWTWRTFCMLTLSLSINLICLKFGLWIFVCFNAICKFANFVTVYCDWNTTFDRDEHVIHILYFWLRAKLIILFERSQVQLSKILYFEAFCWKIYIWKHVCDLKLWFKSTVNHLNKTVEGSTCLISKTLI